MAWTLTGFYNWGVTHAERSAKTTKHHLNYKWKQGSHANCNAPRLARTRPDAMFRIRDSKAPQTAHSHHRTHEGFRHDPAQAHTRERTLVHGIRHRATVSPT